MKFRRKTDGKGMKRTGKLTGQQKLELMVGSYRNSAFSSEEEAREAWFAHRDELCRSTNVGTRCWAWWRFEVDGKDRVGMDAQLYLIECGELTEGEAAQHRFERQVRQLPDTQHPCQRMLPDLLDEVLAAHDDAGLRPADQLVPAEAGRVHARVPDRTVSWATSCGSRY